jgi:Tol biopolymer transport system component
MTLAPGARLGVYEITGLAGAGGMGEVYRARDTRLNRDVALKVLPSALALDPERLARFEREAQILASIGHANIAGILGVEQAGGANALVLEYVEGATLAERIGGGPLPCDEALALARQIAEALEAAHERGIVHRDLKPANIKVRPDGIVKVLDFGLAKAFQPESLAHDIADSPTLTSPALTAAGVILGTAAYMSPEQARGRTVDKRTDNWAFGCVLYEMLTGVRAFPADTITDTLAAIVGREPDLHALPAGLPPAIGLLLRRCFEKDVRRRLRDIGEARIAIENVLGGDGSGSIGPEVTRRSRRPMLAFAIGSSIVAALIAGAVVWRLMQPDAAPVVRLSVVPPGDAPLAGQSIAMTPDRQIVFVSGNGTQLSVRALGELAPRHLTNLGRPDYPFVSPDGRWIGFFDGVNALKIVPVTGGPAVTLCTLRGAAGRGGTWTSDGAIVFATDDPATGLWRVPERGGTPELLTTPRPGEGDQLWPQMLPGQRTALVTVLNGPDQRAQGARVAVVDLTTGDQKVLMPGGGARYVPTGHLVYGAAGALRAVGFDVERHEIRGTPVSIVEQIAGAGPTGTSQAGSLGLAFASDGTLAYVPALAGTSSRLVWVDRERREEVLTAPSRGYVIPRISPDGSKVALDTRDASGADIWVWDLAGRALTRVTFGTSVYPVWTRDSRRLVHTTFDEARVGRLFLRAPDGSTGSERLTEGPNSRYASSVTHDGSRMLFREEAGETGLDIGMVSLLGDRTIETVIKTPANELNPEISPDGRWLAYESNQSGEDEIYVRPFPDVNAAFWQVSTTGGRQPAWSPKGNELFYRSADGAIMAVPVALEPRFTAGQAVRVVDGSYATGGPYRSYDVAADGNRFLMIKREADASRRSSAEIVVVQNWFEELRRLVPVR